jgi:uncharacterized membrane protein (UPF0127 family)
VTGRGPLPRLERLGGRQVRLIGEDGSVLGAGYVADRWRARAIGLLGTPRLGPSEFLWIPRCARVHTWGMATDVACVFLDRDGAVVRIVDPVGPWRIVGARGATSVVEAAPGLGGRVRLGERLTVAD